MSRNDYLRSFVRAIHHSAIVTADVGTSLRFWRDGLGLVELLDYEFKGDWPTLFDADVDLLRSVFLGDPERPDAGIVELVQFVGGQVEHHDPGSGPRYGFFLLSLERDVEATLAALADLGFAEGVRRIAMPAPGGKTVAMAVVTAPDGVRVELIGAPS
jgi:catechol 2,3-dioxygenase-like lactoylglutathione lyase family enzyme